MYANNAMMANDSKSTPIIIRVRRSNRNCRVASNRFVFSTLIARSEGRSSAIFRDFDTVLGVYTGEQMSNLEQIAYNDDYYEGNLSCVTFMAEKGSV